MITAPMPAEEIAADALQPWPVPDMSVLSAGRRPPVPMPQGLFGPAWALLEDIAEGTCAPVDYPATAFLTVCASLIGGKRRVRPYRTSQWWEPCIIWAGLVGDPSARKSPALDAVTGPLRLLELDDAGEHTANIRAHLEQSERAKVAKKEWQDSIAKASKAGSQMPPMPDAALDPDEPSRRRRIVIDATPEAMGAILAGNPQGTLHCRDELAGWFASFERYSPGGREFWLEAYGGRPFTFDRKNLAKGPLRIAFNGVSVIGGIQPEKLAATLLDSADDGLVSRFLFAWPDKRPMIHRPRQAADIARLETVYRRLASIGWGPADEAITLFLSDAAADIFEQWERDNSDVDEDSAARFKSFIGKMDGAVLRLALVAEYVAWAWTGGPEPREISENSVRAACEWVDDYAKPMAQRVYGDASLPLVERQAAILGRYIRKAHLTEINTRALMRPPHKTHLPGLREAKAMDPVIEYLTDAGWLVSNTSREGDTPGRQRKDFRVNPLVHGESK